VVRREPGGGFLLDENRISYLRFLRRERQRSLRSGAETAFQQAKTRLLEIRLAEREAKYVEMTEVKEFIDALGGLLRTEISSLAARSSRDLSVRRAIDAAVNETLTRIADEAKRRAAGFAEPQATKLEEVDDA